MRSQELLNAQKLLHQHRQRIGVNYKPSIPVTSDLDWLKTLSVTTISAPVVETGTVETSEPNTVIHHGQIALSALQKGESVHYQLWLALRWLDPSGSGCLSEEAFRTITDKSSDCFLYKRARFNQILRGGNGRYWSYSAGRIWIYRTERVSKNLQIGKLTGQFVYLERTQLFTNIATFRAWCYAAWLANHINPMTRATIERLTGITERTQRNYDQMLGIIPQENIAIGPAINQSDAHEIWWNHSGVFTLRDHLGIQGKAGREYYAWHVPNCYAAPVIVTGRRRTRRHNRNLSITQPMGNAECGDSIRRLFYKNSGAAGKSYLKHNEPVFWKWSESRQGRGIWFSIPN